MPKPKPSTVMGRSMHLPIEEMNDYQKRVYSFFKERGNLAMCGYYRAYLGRGMSDSVKSIEDDYERRLKSGK